MKRCNRCGQDKPLDEYGIHPRGKQGRQAACNRCKADAAKVRYAADPTAHREAARAYRIAHPERIALARRRNHLKGRYGITLEQFTALLTAQGGTCAVCPATEPNGKNWHVDHCHVTGRLRGILCHPCNTALGLLDEDLDRIKRLGEYVQQHCG